MNPTRLHDPASATDVPSHDVRWRVWPKGRPEQAIELRGRLWIDIRSRACVMFQCEPGDLDGDTVEKLEKMAAAS